MNAPTHIVVSVRSPVAHDLPGKLKELKDIVERERGGMTIRNYDLWNLVVTEALERRKGKS